MAIMQQRNTLHAMYKLGVIVYVAGDSGSTGEPAGAREREGADLCKCKPILPVARAPHQVSKLHAPWH